MTVILIRQLLHPHRQRQKRKQQRYQVHDGYADAVGI